MMLQYIWTNSKGVTVKYRFVEIKWDMCVLLSEKIEHRLNSFETVSSFNDADGGILTFKSVHPKHSFAKVDGDGYVTEVAEKNPISNDATVGIYHFKKGIDWVKYAEQMIEKNIRTNNEFYVCPVYNEAIKSGLKIKASLVDEMWGMGTPEELNNFLTHYKA